MIEVNLYESAALRDVTGPAIRPGGFALTERGLARCRLAPGDRVLDVGCGTGAVVDYLRHRHGLSVLGIDLSAVLLMEGCRAHGRVPLVRGRAEQVPTAGSCFGAVLCECMLSLCPEPQRVLQEVRRVLQPDGHLVLTDVYAREPGTTGISGKATGHCCFQGAVDRLTVENRIAEAGFDLVIWEDHTPLLNRLAAQLIWVYGSLDDFWSVVVGPEAARAMSRGGAERCSRPGYYLLVARKK